MHKGIVILLHWLKDLIIWWATIGGPSAHPPVCPFVHPSTNHTVWGDFYPRDWIFRNWYKDFFSKTKLYCIDCETELFFLHFFCLETEFYDSGTLSIYLISTLSIYLIRYRLIFWKRIFAQESMWYWYFKDTRSYGGPRLDCWAVIQFSRVHFRVFSTSHFVPQASDWTWPELSSVICHLSSIFRRPSSAVRRLSPTWVSYWLEVMIFCHWWGIPTDWKWWFLFIFSNFLILVIFTDMFNILKVMIFCWKCWFFVTDGGFQMTGSVDFSLLTGNLV